VLVHESVHDDFLARFTTATDVGADLDFRLAVDTNG